MAGSMICTIPECGKSVFARGWCRNHWNRWRAHGDPMGGLFRHRRGGPCKVAGCSGDASRRGMCEAHYGRWKRYGDPNGGQRSIRGAKLRWLRGHAAHDGDECLTFPFPLGQSGYGAVTIDGVTHRAANAMLRVAHGKPPTAQHECAHSCGNGHLGCVNPRHLRWATSKGNTDDQRRHGTLVKGSRHGMSKLTESDVRKIRELAGQVPQAEIAGMFGVSAPHISSVISGKDWGWMK